MADESVVVLRRTRWFRTMFGGHGQVRAPTYQKLLLVQTSVPWPWWKEWDEEDTQPHRR